jgi:hypothetical protein
VTVPAEQLPDGIKIAYSGDYLSEILSKMLKDLRAYLEDPQAWVKDYITKGPNTWEKLRALETDLQKNLASAETYRKYAERHEHYAQGRAQQIAALKATLEGKQ